MYRITSVLVALQLFSCLWLATTCSSSSSYNWGNHDRVARSKVDSLPSTLAHMERLSEGYRVIASTTEVTDVANGVTHGLSCDQSGVTISKQDEAEEEAIEISGSLDAASVLNGIYRATDWEVNNRSHYERMVTNDPNGSKIHLYWTGSQWVLHYDLDPSRNLKHLLAYARVKSAEALQTSSHWHVKVGKSYESAPLLNIHRPGELPSSSSTTRAANGRSSIGLAIRAEANEVLGVPRQLLPYFAAYMCDAIATGLVMPLLPFHVMELGANAWQLSLVVSANYVAQMIGCVVMGRVSDSYGRRIVLLMCLLASSISYFCVSHANTLVTVTVARIITGAFGGLLPIMQSSVADCSSQDERPKYLGRVMATFGLGFVLGPVLNTLLPRKMTAQTKIRIASLFPLLGFVLSLFFATETKQDTRGVFASAPVLGSFSVGRRRKKKQNFSSISTGTYSTRSSTSSSVSHKREGRKSVDVDKGDDYEANDSSPYSYYSDPVVTTTTATDGFSNPHGGRDNTIPTPTSAAKMLVSKEEAPLRAEVIFLVLNGFLIMYAFGTETIYAMFIKDTFGYGESALSGLFALNGLLMGSFQVFCIKPMINLIGKHATLASGNIILGMGMVGLALIRQRVPHFLLFALHILGYSIADTALVSLVSRYSAPSSQGRDLALNQSAQACARVFSPLVAGLLYERSKKMNERGKALLPLGALPFIVGGICPAVAVLVPSLLYIRNIAQKQHKLELQGLVDRISTAGTAEDAESVEDF